MTLDYYFCNKTQKLDKHQKINKTKLFFNPVRYLFDLWLEDKPLNILYNFQMKLQTLFWLYSICTITVQIVLTVQYNR